MHGKGINIYIYVTPLGDVYIASFLHGPWWLHKIAHHAEARMNAAHRVGKIAPLLYKEVR